MGGVFGGLLSLIEYAGTLFLAILIGSTAFQSGKAEGWKLFLGSAVFSYLIGFIIALFLPEVQGKGFWQILLLSFAMGLMVLIPFFVVVIILYVIREKIGKK